MFVFTFFRPPRTMGEGFVVLQSNTVDIYFYMDEPGMFNYFGSHSCLISVWL